MVIFTCIYSSMATWRNGAATIHTGLVKSPLYVSICHCFKHARQSVNVKLVNGSINYEWMNVMFLHCVAKLTTFKLQLGEAAK